MLREARQYFDGTGAVGGLSHVRQTQPLLPNLIPFGIYTIPEIFMVGATEEELTRSKTPYESGLTRYSELAKGQMLGDDQGVLKILFDPDSLKLLGVHIIGDTVFNYPTLAETYKVAALDGLNKL